MSAFANISLRTACASSVGLALLAGGSALAQQQAVSGQRGAVIEEIIVTAQKREENIRDVPVSISVIGEAQLDNLHATQLTDFAAYVPGFQVVSLGTPGIASISLRGIAALSSSANIGTYIDETPLGSSGLYQIASQLALDMLPYDIARVEVLRGPQGTLYGAGAMGGLLKYVTHAPDLSRREFRLGGGVSDVEGAGDLGGDVRVGVNLPLVEGRLAVRASYARNEIPGYIDNVDGTQDINDGTQESARVALLWQASDAVSLTLTAIRQSIDSDNNAIVALDPATRRPLVGDLVNTNFVDESFKKDTDLYSATLNWDLGWADFTSASGYAELSTDFSQDFTVQFGLLPAALGLGLPGLSFVDVGLDLEKFTQEFRLTSKSTGALEWQLGAFYTKEEGENSQILRIQQLDGTPYPLFPSPPFPFASLDPLLDAGQPSDFEEQAVFGNVSYQFTDRFELGAGVRYSRNDQHFAQVINPGLLSTLGIFPPPGTSPGSSDEDIFTWSLSPQFQLTDAALLYARVATGYQPGGPNIAFVNVPPTVDASTLTSYEIGLKSEFADGRVLFDLTA